MLTPLVTGPGAIPPKRKRGRPRKPRPEEMMPQPAAAAPNQNPALVTRGVIQKALPSSACPPPQQVLEIVLPDRLVVSQESRDSEQRGAVVKCQNVLEPEAPRVLLLPSADQPVYELNRAMVIQRAPVSQPVTQTTSLDLTPATLDHSREAKPTNAEDPPASSEKPTPSGHSDTEKTPPPQAP